MENIGWLDQDRGAVLVGGKGANLSRMLRAGLPVPNGFVVTTDAYRRYLEAADPQGHLPHLVDSADEAGIRELFTTPLPVDLAHDVVTAWRDLGGGAVAVRSSGTAEDLTGASFAGQQDSYLNIRGADVLVDAVRRCFASLWNERAVAYRTRHGVDQHRVALAVVVQKMVEAQSAGVMFTANPVNGRRDETLVSATFGLGEQAVQGGAADTVVVRAGTVEQRSTVDKRVRIQSSTEGSGTVDLAVAPQDRHASALTDAQAVHLAELGHRVEEIFQAPQDIEWVLAPDGALVLVQARPITALSQTVGDIPEDWSVPDDKAMYVRASIIEQMPDPLSPLFADMVRPAVVQGLRTVLRRYFDDRSLRPGDLDFPTINGYAYYYYGRDGMLRLLKQSPQAVAALGGRSQLNGEKLWESAHPAYQQVVANWGEQDLEGLPSRQLLVGVQSLLDAACEYYATVQAVIPLAASAELPFTRLYTSLAKQAGGPPASVFLQGFASRPIETEQSLWSLVQWCRERPGLADALLADRPLGGIAEAADFQRRLAEHLDRFGHTVQTLDFMVPVPADDPTPVMETLRWYMGAKGLNPDERLNQQTARREAAEAELFSRLDPARKAILQPLLVKAQHLAPVREDALADVGLAWPLMRRMLRSLGGRLVDLGVVGEADDIFWLRRDELTAFCDQLDDGAAEQTATMAEQTATMAELVEARRIAWRGQRAATPPQLLPHNAWYKMFHSFMPAMETQQEGPVIKGLGVSQGRITGPARVIRGPEDFDQMLPGEVLVSPITTPDWTPLFAMAAAVVTDVGGPLSHSSIVAREYGIPAVLGTGIATRRIRNGMLITVDADRGQVTMPEGEAPVESGFKPRVPYKFAFGAAAAAALALRKLL